MGRGETPAPTPMSDSVQEAHGCDTCAKSNPVACGHACVPGEVDAWESGIEAVLRGCESWGQRGMSMGEAENFISLVARTVPTHIATLTAALTDAQEREAAKDAALREAFGAEQHPWWKNAVAVVRERVVMLADGWDALPAAEADFREACNLLAPTFAKLLSLRAALTEAPEVEDV